MNSVLEIIDKTEKNKLPFHSIYWKYMKIEALSKFDKKIAKNRFYKHISRSINIKEK